VELGARGQLVLRGTRLGWFARYTWLDATYQSAFVTPGTNHPDAQQGTLAVSPGDRLPGVPRHQAKGGVDLSVARLTVGASAVVASGRYLRGDDPNRLAPVPGAAVIDLRASYQVLAALTVFLRASNVLDTRYSSFGVLGDARAVLGPGFSDPRFETPGAPRALWGGLDLHY
jgi:outer membrane receptor protein involved in Fe transport